MPEQDKNLTLSTQGDKHLPGGDSIPSLICPPRHNCDKTTNKNGSQVLQLSHTLGLYIVHSSSLGSSTVDYFITNLNLESLRAFTVSH
jgi:hypothetical protein